MDQHPQSLTEAYEEFSRSIRNSGLMTTPEQMRAWNQAFWSGVMVMRLCTAEILKKENLTPEQQKHMELLDAEMLVAGAGLMKQVPDA